MFSWTFVDYHVLVFELLLYKLSCISKFWELHLLCLHDERWEVPLVTLFVPVCQLFELLDLIITHEVCHNLLKEV